VKDVKELLYCYLSPIAKTNKCTVYQAAKASSERWLLLGILSWAFVSILPFYLDGCYWTLFVMPLVAWLLVANFWHDCLHFSYSKDWRINATLPYLLPILSSPWLWYHQHVIGHHTYTNVGMKDPDLAHAPQLKREHASIKWKKCHRNQGSYFRFILVWSIASCIGINILNDIKTNIKLSYNNVVGYQKLSISRFCFHLFGRVVYAFITILWPLFQFSLWKAAFWIVIPNIVFSCLFMINTQINHLTEECCNSSDTNFLKHQVVTAQNFGIGSVWNFFLSGGLNYQIEHHLFPFVNHCHLPYLASGVKEICAKHGVRYQEVDGYKMAFIQHLQHTIELSKDPSILTKKEM
jgi:delta11-fatty-acid desaturase